MSGPLRDFFGAPEDAGLLVQGIEPGSAAEGAKIRVGDVIVEVDGQRIARVADVRHALSDRRKGDAVKVRVIRSKKRKTLTATITTKGASFSGSDFDLELPPEVWEHLDPATREQVQRQLEHAKEQLRRVEQQLQTLEHGHDDPAEAPEGADESKGKAKRKVKRKLEKKRKNKEKKAAPAD